MKQDRTGTFVALLAGLALAAFIGGVPALHAQGAPAAAPAKAKPPIKVANLVELSGTGATAA